VGQLYGLPTLDHVVIRAHKAFLTRFSVVVFIQKTVVGSEHFRSQLQYGLLFVNYLCCPSCPAHFISFLGWSKHLWAKFGLSWGETLENKAK
jgi:hypothetical protein